MRIKQNILGIALVMSAIFLSPTFFRAQKNILELLPGSERMSYDERAQIHTLAGKVSFIYQGNTMYCDSAVYFQKRNFVKAYGNVHINKSGSINIFSDSLWFDGNKEIGYLWGHVRARDQEYKLTTDSLEYQAKSGKAIYRHGGKVESNDGKEVLTSKVGYFYPEIKNFFFKDNVRYKSAELTMHTDSLQYTYLKKQIRFSGPSKIWKDSTYIECREGYYHTETEVTQLMKGAQIFDGSKEVFGDTLQYFPKKKISIGKGNVHFRDTVDKMSLHGDYLYKNDSTGLTYLTKRAYAFQEKDSLYIHADTLFSLSDSLKKVVGIKAYRGVRIFQKDVQGRCDSLLYVKSKDVMEMHRFPILWTSKGELKGDTIFVHFKDSMINRAYINQNANAIFSLDSSLFFNQVAGKSMLAHFKNNEITRVDVTGNAQTIYFPEKTELTDTATIIKRSGMNRLYASYLKVYIDSGEVSGLTYFDQPDGKFYPIKDIDEKEKYIPSFTYLAYLRTKFWEDIFCEDSDFTGKAFRGNIED